MYIVELRKTVINSTKKCFILLALCAVFLFSIREPSLWQVCSCLIMSEPCRSAGCVLVLSSSPTWMDFRTVTNYVLCLVVNKVPRESITQNADLSTHFVITWHCGKCIKFSCCIWLSYKQLLQSWAISNSFSVLLWALRLPAVNKKH